MRQGRLVIIGLDGVPYQMIKDFAEGGIMPCTNEIIQNGFFRPIVSSIPEVSSVAWSSIITGSNPAEHGIFGFTDLHRPSYKLRFPNFNDLKISPFWDRCEGESIIINVPSTYPVREINGVHISGFVSIDFEKSVFPKSLIPKLDSLDYRLDVDSEKAHRDLDLFVDELDRTLTARIKAAEYLWEYAYWRNFMLVFTGTDRLMHFLWSAYEDKKHRYHNIFLEHFRRIDSAIGDICSKLAENDALIILSDHGFEKLEADIYVNYLLAKEGFLEFKPDSKPKPINIDYGTKAFALDPARIYINRKGKYAAGSVELEDREACLNDLVALFSSLQIDGRKVVKDIYRKEDIYEGLYIDEAPDLVLIAEEGFNLKGSMSSDKLVGKGIFTGKHTYYDAFLLVKDKSYVSRLNKEQPSVIDAGNLIKSLIIGN